MKDKIRTVLIAFWKRVGNEVLGSVEIIFPRIKRV